MSLEMDFQLTVGTLDMEVSIDAPGGEVTAVLGPNGAGKTTLLRAVAGNRAVDYGRITLNGEILDSAPNVFLAPERRQLGVVHQDYLLFPHMTALANVAFGPRSHGRSRTDSERVAQTELRRVGMEQHRDSMPGELSGGQAQRVALARALAIEPRALLLDEPLAALDAGTRSEVRRELREHLAGFDGPTLMVTHDPVDAFALADRVAILEAGRITQNGTLADVTRRPRSRYVADLIGTNLVRGLGSGTTITTDSGMKLTTADPVDGPVFATIAPEAVALHLHEPEGSPRNRWEATISQVEPLGDRVRIRIASPLDLVAEVTPAAVSEMGVAVGGVVWVSVKATEVHAYLD